METDIKEPSNLSEKPEILGIKEHYESAKWFLEKGLQAEDETEKFRLFLAGIYFSRAIIEIIVEFEKKQKGNPEEFERALEEKLPFSRLVKRIRIHNFHRFGCKPPQQDIQMVFFGGPITLESQGKPAYLKITPQGPEIQTENPEKWVKQRPLLQEDNRFWDEQTKESYPLDIILTTFLSSIPEVISSFEKGEILARNASVSC